MISHYPRALKALGGLAILLYMTCLGISLYGVFFTSKEQQSFASPLMMVTMITGVMAVLLMIPASIWASRFTKHFRETEVFSGSYRVLYKQIIDGEGEEFVEVICMSELDTIYLEVFQLPLNETTRSYELGDTINLVWSGKDTRYQLMVFYQHALPA